MVWCAHAPIWIWACRVRLFRGHGRSLVTQGSYMQCAVSYAHGFAGIRGYKCWIVTREMEGAQNHLMFIL